MIMIKQSFVHVCLFRSRVLLLNYSFEVLDWPRDYINKRVKQLVGNVYSIERFLCRENFKYCP